MISDSVCCSFYPVECLGCFLEGCCFTLRLETLVLELENLGWMVQNILSLLCLIISIVQQVLRWIIKVTDRQTDARTHTQCIIRQTLQ